jgi:O-antigen biosynthesis protein WbqP
VNRMFDIFIALVALIIMALPASIISLLIKLNSRGPVLYWSKRAGAKGTYFMMPKFRSMNLSTPEVASNNLKNPENFLTFTGRILRRTSLDEIPQFISVLLGYMSIVGPRPALHSEYQLINRRRELGIDQLRPGITGLAQISGRDNLELQQKLSYDHDYLVRKNLKLDIKIIFLTVVVVLMSLGVKF